MESLRNVIIDQKCFEFKKVNEWWWRCTESSCRAVNYISFDQASMGWLAAMVKEGIADEGPVTFIKTRIRGPQVLVVQRQRNAYGRFFSISEFGQVKRRGLIVIPEGSKGEGWRNFGEMLQELSAAHQALGVINRGRNAGKTLPPPQGHQKFSYKEALSRAPKISEVAGNLSDVGKDQEGVTGSRGMSGPLMGTVLHAVAEMEKQVRVLQSNMDVLKRCVKEGHFNEVGLGHSEGPLVLNSKGLHKEGPSVIQASLFSVPQAAGPSRAQDVSPTSSNGLANGEGRPIGAPGPSLTGKDPFNNPVTSEMGPVNMGLSACSHQVKQKVPANLVEQFLQPRDAEQVVVNREGRPIGAPGSSVTGND